MAQYSSIQNSNLLRGMLLGGVVAVLLTGCGGEIPPPPPSNGADLSGTEMMALRGDPYATRYLTPAQQQRVSAYHASHPDITPTWGRDATNMLVAGGAGYLAGSTLSTARTGAVMTTGAATEEVVAPAVERVAAGEVLGEAATTEVVGTEVVEGLGLLEVLEDACLIVCW